jgi:CRP/FNR family transcriptional regulator
MQIDTDILIDWGAVPKKYKKNEIIFLEGDTPRYYCQILSGKVRMFNTSNETKELTQGIFGEGESFAEPPIFINETYPATAVALCDTVLIRILKEKFMQLLDKYPELQKKFLKIFSERIYEKSLLARELVSHSPEERIKNFLYHYKKKYGNKNEKIHINFTRQEIANFTGLRVETVIRTLQKMKIRNIVSIVDKKLYY